MGHSGFYLYSYLNWHHPQMNILCSFFLSLLWFSIIWNFYLCHFSNMQFKLSIQMYLTMKRPQCFLKLILFFFIFCVFSEVWDLPYFSKLIASSLQTFHKSWLTYYSNHKTTYWVYFSSLLLLSKLTINPWNCDYTLPPKYR